MLQNVSRAKLITAWVVALAVLFAVSVIWGAGLSLSTAELWLLAVVAPPAVMLLVWRAPTRTVAELLYAVNQPDKDGRP